MCVFLVRTELLDQPQPWFLSLLFVTFNCRLVAVPASWQRKPKQTNNQTHSFPKKTSECWEAAKSIPINLLSVWMLAWQEVSQTTPVGVNIGSHYLSSRGAGFTVALLQRSPGSPCLIKQSHYLHLVGIIQRESGAGGNCLPLFLSMEEKDQSDAMRVQPTWLFLTIEKKGKEK